MTAVVARARALTGRLQNVVGATASDETWSQIAAYLEQVSPQVSGLQRQLDRIRVLELMPRIPQLQRVRRSLDEVRKTFNSNPDQMGQGEVAAVLRLALTDAVKLHREDADEGWTKMRNKVLEDAAEGLLRIYAAVPEARPSAEKAAGLRSRIDAAATAPNDADRLAALKEAVEALRRIVEAVRKVSLPREVETFLDSALRGQARWAQLTPSVIEWLDEHDMLQTLRVKVV